MLQNLNIKGNYVPSHLIHFLCFESMFILHYFNINARKLLLVISQNQLYPEFKDKEELEKFAREEYHMKKENEDIYIIEFDTLKK